MGRHANKQPPTKLGEFLKGEREKLNLNQTEFAKKLGISPKSYNAYEVGGKIFSRKTAIKISNSFLNPDILLSFIKASDKTGVSRSEIDNTTKLETNNLFADCSNDSNVSLLKNSKSQKKDTEKLIFVEDNMETPYRSVTFVELLDLLRVIKECWNNDINYSISQFSNNLLYLKKYEVVLEVGKNYLLLTYLQRSAPVIDLCNEMFGDPILNSPYNYNNETQNTANIQTGYSIWIYSKCTKNEKFYILISRKPESLLTHFTNEIFNQFF